MNPAILKFFNENKKALKESIQRRGLDEGLVGKIEKLAQERAKLSLGLQDIRTQKNKLNPGGVPDDQTRTQLKKLSDTEDDLLKQLIEVEKSLDELLIQLPNLTAGDTPDGGEEDFKVLEEWGKKPTLKNPKDHEELGRALDLIDFEAGTKVSGNKFYFLKNEAVMLEFALIQYVMKILVSEGFIPMVTPQIVKNEVLEGIGFNPKGVEKQVYGVDEPEMSLIGTSEITLGGYHKDEVIDSSKLPIKYAGFSTCFRTEAGAYGKHSKGLYRVHQFDKVEMFIYCLPEESEKMHLYLLSLEKKIFQGLEIPFRVIDIASGDLGAPAYKKFDIEAWMNGRGDYGEVTSTSNTTNFQSIRLNEKFDKEGGKDFVHTLNGTAVAISRALIALLENNQQEDGSIKVPKVLQDLCGFSEIKR